MKTIDKAKQGSRVRYARVGLGISQKKLAAETSRLTGDEISHNIISQIEKGNRGVWNEEMVAFALILRQPREWLEGTSDEGFEAKGVWVSSRKLVAA